MTKCTEKLPHSEHHIQQSLISSILCPPLPILKHCEPFRSPAGEATVSSSCHELRVKSEKIIPAEHAAENT